VPNVLNAASKAIIDNSQAQGWVLEPDAKRLLAESGVTVPEFAWCHSEEEALKAAESIGYPLVAKVVSVAIVHKTDVDGVAVGVAGPRELAQHYQRFSRMPDFNGILIDEMVSGLELIIGGKIDFQFGPVVLMGIGGTAVEIYQDAAIRMAPLAADDVESMIADLRGNRLLTGYRGQAPISITHLTRVMLRMSDLLLALEDRIESLDLNPVFCSDQHCIAADARIILKK
jgi:succinyl-CoA synthetase beta subunit